jgi:hypothetical protein
MVREGEDGYVSTVIDAYPSMWNSL